MEAVLTLKTKAANKKQLNCQMNMLDFFKAF